MRTDGAIVCFGEMLLRLSAPGAQYLLQTPQFEAAYGGAEANVAVSLARMGNDARMVSAVPDNALGRAARDELRKHGVAIDGVALKPGRMGLYFVTPAAGPRAAEVIYDRAHSAFAETDFAAVDWGACFAGAGWFHLSGIAASLGPDAAKGATFAAREARRLGLTVSFDCNYRAKLWERWRGDAPAILRQLIGEADLVFGDQRDIGLVLGTALGDDGRAAADAAFAGFPNLQRIANTRRTEHSASHHKLGASMYARAGAWAAPALNLTHIVDRIGGGDAFAAGVVHGLRRTWDEEKVLRFALAASALKHVTPGDANLAREEDVFALLSGDTSVRR